MTAFEDGTATLDCTYKATSTQYPNLLWYQQKTNRSPKYMLISLSGSSNKDEEFNERFNAVLNTSASAVPLTIKDLRVSDSAVYYCALKPTVLRPPRQAPGGTAVFGNTIKPNTTDVSADEGQNVKLSCSYSSTGGSDDLFWYRQYERSKPEFLVSTFSTARDPEVSKVDPRFSVKVEKKEQIHVYLIISSAAVSDSALYYCALRPTVTGNTRTLNKNPSVFNPLRTSNRHRDKDYKRICKLQM
ncbi:T-cell receptor alpha chain V region CTL-F3 [Anabarilius grahami]|nr:T-cell receptor alpha chain V region CTL-F3 [Anabarilius grahami]